MPAKNITLAKYLSQQYLHRQEQMLIYLTSTKKIRELSIKNNSEFINHQQITTMYLWN